MKRNSAALLIALLAAHAGLQPAAAQSPGETGVADFETPLPIDRYALVVGVQQYREHDPVPNAINDAQAVGKALESTGRYAHIRVLVNPDTKEDIVAALGEILHRAGTGAATIVFYYAGHGFQFDRANYIMPARVGRPARVSGRRETNKEPLVRPSLDIGVITARLEKRPAGANILFIDACRSHVLGVNSDFPGEEVKGYLKPIPQNTLISFSTGYGDVANSYSSRTPRNSPYAAMLSEKIAAPQPIRLHPDILSSVTTLVKQATGSQEPDYLHPDAAGQFFYFHQSQTEKNAELAMWRKAKSKNTRNCMDNFLHYYRDGDLSSQVAPYVAANPIRQSTFEEPLCDLLYLVP